MLFGIRDELQRALPTLSPQRKRLPRSLGQIEFPMGPDRFRRDAMPYTLWMFQRVQDHCAQLDATSHAAVEDRNSTRLELQSLMRISYAVFCLKKKTNRKHRDKVGPESEQRNTENEQHT